MGTAKRERQKAGRQSRRVEAELAAARAKRNRNFRNYALYGGVIVAVVVGIIIFNRGSNSSKSATTTTASTIPSTTTFAYGTTDCPPTDGSATQIRTFAAPFKQCIDPTKTYTAVIKTNKGDLKVSFDPAKAPGTVNNFVSLALFKFYDGISCHRIIPSFVVQCGDPAGTGSGGPGYKFADELPKAGDYKLGSLAMANSGANTNGSQFFIISGDQGVALPPNYSLFGQVTDGIDTTLKALDAAGTAGDGKPSEPITIISVTIQIS